MSFTVSNGFGFNKQLGAVVVDMAAVDQILPNRTNIYQIRDFSYTTTEWIPWGNNNLLPLEMIADIKRTGILTSIIEGKSRFATCQGMVPVLTEIDKKTGQRVIKQFLDDAEIDAWLTDNNSFLMVFAWIRDYIAFGRCVSRLILNKKRDYIASLKRADVSQHRVAKMDGRGRINHLYFSKEWHKVTGLNSDYVVKVPLLNPDNEFKDLLERTKGKGAYEYAMMNTHPGWDDDYYPTPLWMSNLKWIRIVQSLPEMKNALYNNAIRAKYKIVINESFWKNRFGDRYLKGSEAEIESLRNQIYDEIEAWLVGAKNAGKAIFTDGYRDRDGNAWSDINIEPIKDDTKQGEYLPDSAAGNSEISFSMLWNNALTGGNQKTGLYSENQGGSNVREASAMQVIIHEVERQQVQSIMNVVSRFNGWDKKHKGLRFIIPATILTTLDTGASTKPIVTGGDVKTTDNNGTDKNNTGS